MSWGKINYTHVISNRHLPKLFKNTSLAVIIFHQQFLPVLNCYSYLPAIIIRPWLGIRRKNPQLFLLQFMHITSCSVCHGYGKKCSISMWHSILCSHYHVVTHRLFIVAFSNVFLSVISLTVFVALPWAVSTFFMETHIQTGFSISAKIFLKSHRSKESLLSCNLFLFILHSMMFPYSQQIINMEFSLVF